MERDSQNMDDFIRKGLESFGDEPSNAVWEGLASQIEAEKPFYQKASWRKKAGVYSLLGLLLLGNLYFGYQWKNSLETTQTLQSENEDLKDSLKEANNSLFEIGTIIDLYDQEKNNPEPAKNKAKPSIETPADLVETNKVLITPEVVLPLEKKATVTMPQNQLKPIQESPIIERQEPTPLKEVSPVISPKEEAKPDEFKDIEVPIMAIDRPADSPSCVGCLPKVPQSIIDTIDFEEMIRTSLKEWKEEHLPKVKIFKRGKKE